MTRVGSFFSARSHNDDARLPPQVSSLRRFRACGDRQGRRCRYCRFWLSFFKRFPIIFTFMARFSSSLFGLGVCVGCDEVVSKNRSVTKIEMCVTKIESGGTEDNTQRHALACPRSMTLRHQESRRNRKVYTFHTQTQSRHTD